MAERRNPVIIYDKYKSEWIKWAEEEAPSVYKKYKNYLEKYLSGKEINTPEELISAIDIKNRHLVNAVRNFLRFLEKTGKMKKSELIDFQAILTTEKSRERSEVEKYIENEAIIEGYNNIIGSGKIKKARHLGYKLLLFTGLRKTEVIALMNQFDKSILEKSYKAFKLEHLKDKIAIYDLDQVKIETRKNNTKRGYVALFPIELVDEFDEIRGYTVNESTFDPEKMFSKDFQAREDLNLRDKSGKFILLAKLRKFHMNFLNDNAWRVRDRPADFDKIVEFIQGRTPKTVGGRNYRENVQIASKIYYELVDNFKENIPIV